MKFTESQITAIITASAAIGGVFITGIISLLTQKISGNREDRRRREDLMKSVARERINNLYQPLREVLSFPDGEFEVEHEHRSKIIDIVGKNHIYASPGFLDVYYTFLDAFRNYAPVPHMSDLDWRLYEVICDDYDGLKEMLGYGSITRKRSWLRLVFRSVISWVKRQWVRYARWYRQKTRPRRQRSQRKKEE